MKTLLIVADDKIGRRCLREIRQAQLQDVVPVLDSSFSVNRVFRLVRRGHLKLPWLFHMAAADLLRRDTPVDRKGIFVVKDRDSIFGLLESVRPDRVLLFRCGLIINQKILDRGIPIFNIHCADIPEYGGLGAINRAIADRSICQHAVLHVIDSTAIDAGTVLACEPYQLILQKSFRFNEDIAFDAGIRLCVRMLRTLSPWKACENENARTQRTTSNQ